MNSILHSTHFLELLSFFTASDPVRKMQLGGYLINWFAVVFLFSLFVFFYTNDDVYKMSSLISIVSSPVAMIIIKINMP